MNARKRRFTLFIVFAYIAFILIAFLLTNMYNSQWYIITEVNHIMKLTIPYNSIVTFENNGGGFHGDGEIITIIKLNESDNIKFNDYVTDKWMELDTKNDIYNFLWDKETVPGNVATGGILNKKLYPQVDLKYILYDIETGQYNEAINLHDLLDFYYIGYSFIRGEIYIQKTNI